MIQGLVVVLEGWCSFPDVSVNNSVADSKYVNLTFAHGVNVM